MQFYFISYVIWLTEVGQLFYLTTHDYVVILCVPPTFAMPAFVVWLRGRVRSLRLTDEKPQCLYKRLFGGVCRRWTLSKEMAASPEEPLVKQTSLPNC